MRYWLAIALAIRSSISVLPILRLARVTVMSLRPCVLIANTSCARTASTMRCTATVPVAPRSGARNTAICAAAPALSIRSPMRTRSSVTITFCRSDGASGASPVCAAAAAGIARQSARVRMRIMAYSSAEQVGGRLQHLVGCGDDLGVHFVGALRGDQIGDFAHRLDIGLFEIALLQVAEILGVRLAGLRPGPTRAFRDTGCRRCPCRPALLTNTASSIWPTTVGVVEPVGVADTWPCALMVTPVEFCGIVMPG